MIIIYFVLAGFASCLSNETQVTHQKSRQSLSSIPAAVWEMSLHSPLQALFRKIEDQT